MSMRRKIWRILVTLLVAATVSELMCAAALRVLGLWPQGAFAEAYRSYDARPANDWQKSPRLPHPYFGPVSAGGLHSANNYGFSSPEDYPYVRKPGDYVIGIFGGSFASIFAKEAVRNHWLKNLSQEIPWLADRRIVVLNLAIDSAKQPQQFFVASYFMPMIDLGLNIDGYSEILEYDLRYPVEYPALFHIVHGPGRPLFWERIVGEAATGIPDVLTQAALRLSVLRASATYMLFWKAAIHAQELTTASLLARMKTRSEPGLPNKLSFGSTKPEVLTVALADVWERYARLESTVARAEGKQVVFFLQPNAHIRPGKPLNRDEIKMGIDYEPAVIQKYNERFDHIRQRARKMNQEGIPTFDLSDAFVGLSQTIYRDGCCHVFPAGNEILAKRIVEALAQLGPKLRTP